MTLWNNAEIELTRELTPGETKAIEERYGDFLVVSDSRKELIIEEAGGDLEDELNKLVNDLKEIGVAPLEGEANRYYGDYDGYDVFTGERFESMDDGDYAIYCLTDEDLIRMLESRGYRVTKVPKAEDVLRKIAEAQEKGNASSECPRCGKPFLNTEDFAVNALSRRFDIYICPTCGGNEAIEDMEHRRMPLEYWYAVRRATREGEA